MSFMGVSTPLYANNTRTRYHDRMISREHAREIAERFLREHGPTPGWDSVGDILSPDEVKASMRDHPVSATTTNRSYAGWVVLILGAAGAMIRISDSDGKIEFAGAVKGDPG